MVNYKLIGSNPVTGFQEVLADEYTYFGKKDFLYDELGIMDLWGYFDLVRDRAARDGYFGFFIDPML